VIQVDADDRAPDVWLAPENQELIQDSPAFSSGCALERIRQGIEIVACSLKVTRTIPDLLTDVFIVESSMHKRWRRDSSLSVKPSSVRLQFEGAEILRSSLPFLHSR